VLRFVNGVPFATVEVNLNYTRMRVNLWHQHPLLLYLDLDR
jgi:hypothetical protein